MRHLVPFATIDRERWRAPLRAFLICTLALLGLGAAAATPAWAETRTLKILFVHTGEKSTVTFKRDGRYIQSGLDQANRALRDFRRNEPTKMDPRLLDLVWEVYQKSGSKDYIHVISGYRSPATNGMLRKRGRGVAKNSQHMLGKAMDFFLPDVPLSKLREIGLKVGVGGVGFYPTSGSPFVHMDTGSVRHWPRMSRQELVRIFPDGKTLHVPTDGKPLPRYDQALAEYKTRGRTSAVTVASAEQVKKPNFFQLLAARAKQDQQDDEGVDEETPASAPVIATAGSAPATVEIAEAPAAPEPAEPRLPVSAIPVPIFAERQRPRGDGDAIAVAALGQEGSRPVPVPEFPQRGDDRVSGQGATEQPASFTAAALSPGEIENLRRAAVPVERPQRPRESSIALPQIRTTSLRTPRPAAAVPSASEELALFASGREAAPTGALDATERLATARALESVAPRPSLAPLPTSASLPASGPLPVAAPERRPAGRTPAQATPSAVALAETTTASIPTATRGPSRRTIELALAAAGDAPSSASRAIRDLIAANGDGGATPQFQATLRGGNGELPAGAIPVPTRNPRKALVAGARPSQAQTRREEIGRFALANGTAIGRMAELQAPQYALAPAEERTLALASFVRTPSGRAIGTLDATAPATLPGVRFLTN